MNERSEMEARIPFSSFVRTSLSSTFSTLCSFTFYF